MTDTDIHIGEWRQTCAFRYTCLWCRLEFWLCFTKNGGKV